MCYTEQVSRPRDQRYHEILERAARLIFQRGYDGTSMQEIAEACGLTKAGLYHHIETKEALLLAIMHYGMDLFDDRVLEPVSDIADPLARLRRVHGAQHRARDAGCDARRSRSSCTSTHADRRGGAGDHARKKQYVQFLEAAFRQASERGQIRAVDPTLAAFSFLGVVLWTYKWYRADGKLGPQQLSDGMIDLFFEGLMPQS